MTALRSWTARCEGSPECGFRAAVHSAALELVFSHAAATGLAHARWQWWPMRYHCIV